MSSNFARISSMLRWSRWSNSRSARTLDKTSRRSSSGELYGAGPRRPNEGESLPLPTSRNMFKLSSALRTSVSTNASSSWRCEIRRCVAEVSISTRRRSSRILSSAPRASCKSRSYPRRRLSCFSNSRRSSKTALLKRFVSPPSSKRATTSNTLASWPKVLLPTPREASLSPPSAIPAKPPPRVLPRPAGVPAPTPPGRLPQALKSAVSKLPRA
mmetsp:Transcript_46313/g.140470  ORF Transcript_46313/g.140470 Transcript_46313/m.140470 type:complete len:214 (+) Transcript_46313:508-1149(+)